MLYQYIINKFMNKKFKKISIMKGNLFINIRKWHNSLKNNIRNYVSKKIKEINLFLYSTNAEKLKTIKLYFIKRKLFFTGIELIAIGFVSRIVGFNINLIDNDIEKIIQVFIVAGSFIVFTLVFLKVLHVQTLYKSFLIASFLGFAFLITYYPILIFVPTSIIAFLSMIILIIAILRARIYKITQIPGNFYRGWRYFIKEITKYGKWIENKSRKKTEKRFIHLRYSIPIHVLFIGIISVISILLFSQISLEKTFPYLFGRDEGIRIVSSMPYNNAAEVPIDIQYVDLSFSNNLTFKEAVANSLEIKPEISFSTEWIDDTTLRVNLKDTLDLNTLYNFEFSSGILKNSSQINSFKTISSPEIIYYAPKKFSNNTQQIVVTFNKSVSAIKNVANTDEVPIRIEPYVEGSYEWITPDTIIFSPTYGFNLRNNYSVYIDSSKVTSIDGLNMSEDFSWSIEKEIPVVFERELTKDFYLSENISVRASELLALTRDTVQLWDVTEGVTVPVNINQKTTEYGGVDILIDPLENLTQARSYRLVFSPGTPSQATGATIGKEVRFNFRTYTNFTAKINLSEDDDGEYYPSNPCISFNAPVDKDEALSKITMNGNSLGEINYHSDNMGFCTRNFSAPSTSYNLEISKDLQSLEGTKLSNNVSKSYKTSMYDPNLYIVGDQISYYSASKDVEVWFSLLNHQNLNYKVFKINYSDISGISEKFNYNYSDGKISPNTELNSKLINEWNKDISYNFGEFLNTRQEYKVNITDKLQGEGIYVLLVNNEDYQVIIYSSINISLHSSEDNGLAWVTNTLTGEPVANSELFINENESIGYTDDQGVLQSDKLGHKNGNDGFVGILYTNHEGQFGIVNSGWDDGMGDAGYRFFSDTTESSDVGYIYTDRTLYKPGDVIYFKGYIRDASTGVFKFPEGSKYNLEIFGDTRELFHGYTTELEVNDSGEFNGEMYIPNGSEGLTIGLSIKGISSNNALFSIENYEKSSFFIDINAPENVQVGQNVNVDISAQTYSGVPLRNQKVTWKVVRRDTTTFAPKYNKYNFNNYVNTGEFQSIYGYGLQDIKSEEIYSGETYTDNNGKAIVSFRSSLEENSLYQLNSIEVVVSDNDNEFVADVSDIVVNRSYIQIGSKQEDYFINPNEEVVINYVALDNSYNPVDTNINLGIYKRNYRWEKVIDTNGFIEFEYKFDDQYIEGSELFISSEGSPFNWTTPSEGGLYVLKASINNQLLNERLIWVYSNYYSSFLSTDENANYMNLIKDKDLYSIGEESQIQFSTGFNDYYTLSILSTNNIIGYKVEKKDSGSNLITQEIREDMIPNAFLSITAVNGLRDSENGYSEIKTGRTELVIDYSTKNINIDVSTDKEEYAPRDSVNVSIKTQASNKEAISSNITVSVVDKALIDLALISDTNILDEIYSARSYNLRSANSLVKNIAQYRSNIDWGSKGGGGGGDANSNFDEIDFRKEFKDTAYWQTELTTDENGEASINFDLPDNLTEWVVIVKGVSGTDLFGQSRTSFRTSLDFQIFPNMPRFFTYGDVSSIGANIYNNTEVDFVGSIEVYSDISGEEEMIYTDEVSIMHKSLTNIGANIIVKSTEPVGNIKYILKDENSEVIDSIEQFRDINFATFYEANSYLTDIDNSLQSIETIEGIKNSILEVNLISSIARDINVESKYLRNYSYYCTEQTSSKLIGNLGLAKIGKLDSVGEVETNFLIQQLEVLQRSNGGWGFWENSLDSDATEINTGYALLALYKARELGFDVSQETIDKGIRFLKYGVNQVRNRDITGKALNYFAQSLFDEDAYADMYNIFDEVYYSENIYAKSFLALAWNARDERNSHYYDLLDEIDISAYLTGNNAQWNSEGFFYGATNDGVLETSLAIYTLVNENPNSPIAFKAMNWLSNQDIQNLNTTKSAFIINAVSEFVIKRNEVNDNFEYNLKVNDQYYCNNCEEQSNSIELTETNSSVEVENLSNWGGYVKFTLKSFPDFKDIKAISHGLSIDQFLINENRSDGTFLPGDKIKHVITITVPEQASQLLVEVPVPAGFEIINSNLAGGQIIQGEDKNFDDRSFIPLQYYISDKRILFDKLGVQINSIPKGTYQYTFYSRVSYSGEYNVNPPKVELMYSPDVFGIGEGNKIIVQ